MKRIVLIGAFAVSSLLPLGAQNDGGISDGMLQRIRASYEDTPADRALRNAICNNDIRKLVVNQPNQGEIDTYFSHRVPSKGVTDQQQSGRCWLFSGLNVLRARMIARYGLGAFEFSQNYCFFWDQLEKANMELHDLSLLTVDAIPEDAACLLIYAPTSDISGEERDMLADYVTGGGKLLVMAGPVDGASLDNLYSLLSKYGVTANEGIVIESDREHYAFQAPFALLPDLASSAITDSLIDERYFPILPLSLGLTVGEDTNGATVTPLLTTSDASYSKLAGYELDTYDKEEGDLDGPFTLAVSVEAGSGQMVWFSSSAFLDDKYNALSSGANVNLGMNALSSLVGESEAMAIRSKSLNYNYLTISESTSSLLKVLMIGIVPLAYLGVGIAVVVKRRRMQNEAV